MTNTMMNRIKRRLNKYLNNGRNFYRKKFYSRTQIANLINSFSSELSFSSLNLILNCLPYYQDRIDFQGVFIMNEETGFYEANDRAMADAMVRMAIKNLDVTQAVGVLQKIEENNFINRATNLSSVSYLDFNKVHFACGSRLFDGWLNIDFGGPSKDNYLQLNLCEKLPFPDQSFLFGFAEDFLEHLSQADSIIFLSEAYRVIKKGGVLRLSFPGLEGVLEKHYMIDRPLYGYLGKLESCTYWDHLHFYSREELTLVAKHIGYSEIKFCSYGISEHPQLSGLDGREHQRGLNLYVELIR